PVTYDEGTFRPNVFAEYRATFEGKDGKQSERTVRATQKLIDVKGADGKATGVRELHWVKTSDGSSLGKVGDGAAEKLPGFTSQQALLNLPAVCIVLLVTAVLVKGISESAGFNA